MNDQVTSSTPSSAPASLQEAFDQWVAFVAKRNGELANLQQEIDEICYDLYGIEGEDRAAIEAMLAEGQQKDTTGEDDDDGPVSAADLVAAVGEFLDYTLGAVFGRWDVRFATGDKAPPPEPEPFDPLPVCPPGMLQNTTGLPAGPKDVPADYPLRLSWAGILVDEEGHPEDIVWRIRESIAVIWGDRADAIEMEACDILGIKNLREYFTNPNKFFDAHLKRYSKSRRKAPIYWPLSTASGEYTLWIYYHRLTDQTLFRAVNDFVEPRLHQAEIRLDALQGLLQRSRDEEQEMSALSTLVPELKDLRSELLRLALIWKPNLNDGVQITAAPLWRLFRHRGWQKTLQDTWKALEKGSYDWAHLALSLWPERVVKSCQKDRSIAIAHGLEEALWEEVEVKGKRGMTTVWQAKKLDEEATQKLLEQLNQRK